MVPVKRLKRYSFRICTSSYLSSPYYLYCRCIAYKYKVEYDSKLWLPLFYPSKELNGVLAPPVISTTLTGVATTRRCQPLRGTDVMLVLTLTGYQLVGGASLLTCS